MNYEIHQILYNWVRTLPIDGLTGESIVTHEDTDRLELELSQTIHNPRENQHPWQRVRGFVTRNFQSIVSKVRYGNHEF